MEEIDIQEIKKIGLKTLLFFDDFCNKHNLTYYISYGTLIGAIRHKGFIPWDDDVDLWMMREDYDRLIALSDEMDGQPYKLNCVQSNPDLAIPFAKVTRTDTVLLPSRFITGYLYGCSIDIFPLDTVGDYTSEEDALKALLKVKEKHLKVINKYHQYTGGKKEHGLKRILKESLYKLSTIRYGSISDVMNKYSYSLVDEFPDAKGEYLATVAGDHVFKKEWYSERVYLDFEGYKFPAPIEYDKALKSEYGDYMQLPPKEQQVIPHLFKAYYI